MSLSQRVSRPKAIMIVTSFYSPPMRSLSEKLSAEDTRMTEWFAW